MLIAGSTEQLHEARLRLARVGIEDTHGHLDGGIESWKYAGLPIAEVPQLTVQSLNERLRTDDLHVLDVRRQPEWQAGHITEAAWWPLDNFRVSPPEIDRNAPTVVHCKGGYRSTIACSLLQRAGFNNVINLIGGFDAWQQGGLPVTSEKPVEV